MNSILLEARNIPFHYPWGMESIRNISFHIRKGENIALVGADGAGKSTLLSMFNGMLHQDSGMLLFDNVPVQYDTVSLWVLLRWKGFVLQNPDRRIIAPTVYPDVLFRPVNRSYPDEMVKEFVTFRLRQIGLEGFKRRHTSPLRGGEKNRHSIAGVLAMDPDLLVFVIATVRAIRILIAACLKIRR